MKKALFYLFIPLIFFSLQLTALESPREDLTEDAWAKIEPYLLPDNFSMKSELDQIFSKSRVISNSYTLEQAGFTNSKTREFSRLVVTSHPKLPGYIFKIYLDKLRKKPDEAAQYFFIRRVKGALAIQQFIEDHKVDHLFKVPKKWIYLLPEVESHSKKYSYKNFVLIEEDMHILDKKENKAAWAGPLVTEETLLHLYQLLKEIGLIDCVRIDNIPFSKDGRIAFIDTEFFGSNHVAYKRLKKSLSSEMKKFWLSIID